MAARRRPFARAQPNGAAAATQAAGAERESRELADDAAAEADCDGVGARARLELREDVPDVRLDRLLREEEPLTDLPVHEAVRDQLKDLDLPHRRLLLQLPERALERDDVGGRPATAPGSHRLEATGMVGV